MDASFELYTAFGGRFGPLLAHFGVMSGCMRVDLVPLLLFVDLNSSFWRSLGAIGTDSLSFEAFRPISIFSFFCEY